jgi:hypothetical protein
VFGQAGIGKSTFCQYAAYRWAQGEIWPQYKLIILIPLRSLTTEHYPPPSLGQQYFLVDLLEKEYFPNDALSEADRECFRQQCDQGDVLWLLDGYDEFVQNIPEHLKNLFELLRETQHHIMTSRPYSIPLSYPAQVEIIGFTDDNIPKYIKQFFDQIGSEAQNSSREDENISSFLKRTPTIWGIAHIPIILELICSSYTNTYPSEINTMTMLYDKLTEWICRRYLEKQQKIAILAINEMLPMNVQDSCKDELAFLESLAFRGMQSNIILLGSRVQEEAEDESKCYLRNHPHLLHVGILKSPTQHGTATRSEEE